MSDKTSFFAPEIERALVSTVWHHPEYLELVHRDLDLELHFHEPNLRIVLEMISLVFWEIGGVDWATVVHAVREVDALELCCGRQGLNEVLTAGGYFPWGP